jgi:hypothetical protein
LDRPLQVLLLDRSILWTHKCRFFPENASTAWMKKLASRHDLGWHDLSDSRALAEMFADNADDSVASWQTNDGAEVQVLEPIEPENIVAAWVERADLVERVKADLGQLPFGAPRICVGDFSGECPFENIFIQAEREVAEIREEFSTDDCGHDAYLSDGVSLTAGRKMLGLDK